MDEGPLPVLTRALSNNSQSNGHGHWRTRRTSVASLQSSRSPSQISHHSRPSKSPNPQVTGSDRASDPSSHLKTTSGYVSSQHSSWSSVGRPRLKSQYPRKSTQNHVEYILVASFDIDRGPVMEHQYPLSITGDENMLAELMLPDQAHARHQDWTIFFLHKDVTPEEEDEQERAREARRQRRRRKKERSAAAARGEDRTDPDGAQDDGDTEEDDSSAESEPEGGEGPPLIYVLNLVNTKHDKTVKRGAIVKAMAICTRHPFLHIYKPLLLLALDEYYRAPVPETLSLLYDAVNSMDLSLMPKLSLLEKNLLQASDSKDLFVEKFEAMIRLRMEEDRRAENTKRMEDQADDGFSPARSPGISRFGTKAHIEGGAHAVYAVPRDTHEIESKVMYRGIPVPIKVPTAVMPETVGDFSIVKLIQNFTETHAKSPQPYVLHPHLTTNGTNTHPVIVLVNALLTQKRVIFMGHNMPSGEVAEAVLAACALASGGVLRGFTRHAFPYTDLTKIDDLLNVPGFIAGVTNPTFEHHPEWWDVLCDLPSGRIKISTKIEPAAVTEGLAYFQQLNPSFATAAAGTTNNTNDATGDAAFMTDLVKSIGARLGEQVIRAKWRDWVVKFTRIAAQLEESVYGVSALFIGTEDEDLTLPGSAGHGYVWPDETAKLKELAANVTRIEGWRNTRSYYSFIQDLAQLYLVRPLKGLDLAHLHDRLRLQRLTPSQSRDIYLTLIKHINTYDEICLLLSVAPESHAGLFYVALGLFHKDLDVRMGTADLLDRIAQHEAGQHWWKGLSRFEKLAHARIRRNTNDGEATLAFGTSGSIDDLSPAIARRIS